MLREFVNNPDATIRNADKSNVFVVMDTCYYESKINDFLSDTTKFIKIDKNPTLDLKRKLNKHISIINAVIDGAKLNKLIGHFEPAYIYGNPKIHKKIINPPMLPIVSQIGTPTTQVAAQINDIMTSKIYA